MTLAPLILVVGPSGVGKDSLLEQARHRLSASGRFHFARRVITRPQDAGGEDHEAVGGDQFSRMEQAGAFLLSWHAHGLAYGILKSDGDRRQTGTAVIANVSREVVDEARRTLAPVGVIAVTAQIETLARRLAERGREDGSDIGLRLARAAAPLPHGDDVVVVANDGDLNEGGKRFLAALRQLYPVP